MKKSLLIIPLLLLGSFTFAVEDFPAFPMTIYGNIKIWSSDLNWWTLKVYNSSNKELASYNITNNGKYWSDNVAIEPLLLNKFEWSLNFKVFYNWKIYVVDSIDDSNRWNKCPWKSLITFVSDNCRYDITLKEETSTTSNGWSNWWWNSWWGGWGGWTTQKSNNSKTNSWANQNSWSKDNVWNKIEIKTEQNNRQINKNNSVNNNSQNERLNSIRWNPQEVLKNWFTREMNDAYEFSHKRWITTVNSIEKAKMNSPLTRIAMAKMLSNYAINVLWKQPDPSKWIIKFNDVTDKMNEQYDNAVTKAYQLWIMWQNMKNNKFRPNDEVTRAEFATALSRLLYNTQDWSWKYYETHMTKLYKEWVISKMDPKIKEKRWYVMIMLMRSI